MKTRLLSFILVTATSVAFFALTMQQPAGQSPVTGRQIPRSADGKPNFTGVWQAVNAAAWNIQSHHASPFPGLPAQFGMPGGVGVVDGNEIPYQPWAAAKQKANLADRATLDPETKCYLPGVPRIMYMPFPFQIFHTSTFISMLFEYVHATRNIYMDSPHPKGPIEWWMGDSRARWEGDTLVVDVIHFNDETWFDRVGNFHSDALHLIERYTFMTADHINYEVTVEDPKVFTRPWKISMPLYRRQERNAQILEFECHGFDEEVSFGPK